MLEDFKKIYEERANCVPNWKSLERSDLCFKYCACTDKNLQESYLSAIICKFWNVAEHNYNSQTKKLATEEDCYDWMINSILYVLERRVWENPENVLYEDKNAPEKAINIRIFSTKINFYNSYKYQKRVLNKDVLSLDTLEEGASDGYYLPYYDNDNSFENYIIKRVQNYVDKKDYLAAFILDAFIGLDLLSTDEEDESSFSMKKLKKHLRNLNDDYIVAFCNKYSQDCEKVKQILVSYIQNDKFESTIDNRIQRVFKAFVHDKEFKSFLEGKDYVG